MKLIYIRFIIILVTAYSQKPLPEVVEVKIRSEQKNNS
jgi:hypothetical protein